MKDGIDYMEAEMRANIDRRPYEGDEFAVGFSVGWRAALEAANARAEAKGGAERARYWADPDEKYWAWRGDRGVWVHLDGEVEQSRLTPFDWDVNTDTKSGYVPCTTEAEARRVAGFAEEKA
jgi:hypothetical protein